MATCLQRIFVIHCYKIEILLNLHLFSKITAKFRVLPIHVILGFQQSTKIIY